MKKIYLFLILMTLTTGAFSQCFVYEGFDGSVMPPPGWSINGLQDQWTVANSSVAGGVMPEAKFTYIDQTTTTRLISPMLDLTGLTSIKLSFRHMYDDYSGSGPKLGVATRNHNGTWTSVWEINPTTNVGPELKEITITSPDVGQDEFQFCFYLDGNMYNIDYWYLDNVLCYNALQTNAAMTAISTPKYFDGPVDVTGTVMNLGNDAITDLGIAWKVDDGVTSVSVQTGLNIGLEETYDFTSSFPLLTTIGEHQLTVWIYEVNYGPDDYQGDDTLVKTVYKVCNTMPRLPFFEEFTSSTCSPCAAFNSDFVPWCDGHDADSTIALIKYQMSWPSPGDPYYNADGQLRREFYGVNAVPDLYCNGGVVATDIGEVQSAYDAAITLPGLVDICGAFTLTGHVIDVTATVLPFTDFENVMIGIGVFEEITYNNHMTNGETEFEHVEMKMLPDGDGTVVNLTDRTPYTINQSFDLTSTHMERWDDVSVVIFVQDVNSKEIYQAAYGKLNAMLGIDASLIDLQVNSVTIPGFNPSTLTYDYFLPPSVVELPVVTAIPADDKAVVIVVPAIEIPGTTTIDVFSEDLVTHQVYSVDFAYFPTGVDEPGAKAVNAYPNPTKGRVNISGAEGAVVTVTDSKGQIILNYDSFSGSNIDLSGYSKGVYLLNINVPGKTPVHKRVVLY